MAAMGCSLENKVLESKHVQLVVMVDVSRMHGGHISVPTDQIDQIQTQPKQTILTCYLVLCGFHLSH